MKNPRYNYDPFLESEQGGGVAVLERQPAPVSYPPLAPVHQDIPTGNFVYPYIEVEGHPDNKVPVGEEIKLRAHYSAHYPGQPWYAPAWTVSVKAVGGGIAVKNDTTHMTEGPVTGSPYLNHPYFPTMPDKAITLEVTLWGNPDAWQELPLP